MEAVIAFDSQNHPFICEFNSRFIEVLVKVVIKFGMIGPEHSKESCRKMLESNSEELNNRLALIFGPYIASIRIFREKNTATNLFLESTKTSRISFLEYLDNVILHITDSHSRSKTPMKNSSTTGLFTNQRNLHYFTQILKFTFGSNPTSSRNSESQTKLALKLYRHWSSCSTTSPSYLFEVSI